MVLESTDGSPVRNPMSILLKCTGQRRTCACRRLCHFHHRKKFRHQEPQNLLLCCYNRGSRGNSPPPSCATCPRLAMLLSKVHTQNQRIRYWKTAHTNICQEDRFVESKNMSMVTYRTRGFKFPQPCTVNSGSCYQIHCESAASA